MIRRWGSNTGLPTTKRVMLLS